MIFNHLNRIYKSYFKLLSQIGVGEDIGVHQTTVCKIFWYVCDKILQKSDDWVHFPSTEAELEDEKQVWRRKYKFPCAIGAIDCSLFAIKKPSVHGDEYICRKNFPAFNAQATCNANEMFTSFDCSWAGSVHDARIWRTSEIQRTLNENAAGALLLADEGYPLTPWTMTIYKNPNTRQQLAYSALHKRERVLIERMFGELKRRFHVLANTIRVKTARIPKLISACIVLFNVGKFLNDPEFDEEENENEEEEEDHPMQNVPRNNTLRRQGEARRDQIAATIAGL